MNRLRLEGLIQDVLDGEPIGEELEALQHELRANPEARAIYRDHIRINAALTPSSESVQQPVAEIIPMDRLIERQRRKALKITAIGTAAAIVALAFVLKLVVLPNAPVARFKISPKTDFTLTHAVPDGEAAPEGRVVEVGSRLTVERGAVELSFASGVKGIIRGPADFTLREEDLVELRSGTVWFDVPRAAVGFRVDTPDFLLTDLGTEFGVVSRPDVMDEVHVFSGEVEVRHHRGLEEAISVTEGQARVAGRLGGWEEADYSPTLFATHLPNGDPAPPYLYWSFDGFEGDSLPVEGTHPAAAEISSSRGIAGEGPQVVEGRVGRALSFDKVGDHIETDWPGIGGGEARSVAFWLRLPPVPDGTTYNSTYVTWGEPLDRKVNESWSVRVTNIGIQLPPAVQAQMHGRTFLQLWFGATVIDGTTDLADGEWHHVAVCYKGGADPSGRPKVDVYLDGRWEPTHFSGANAREIPVRTATGRAGVNPLLIGRSKTRREVSCDAALDELFIFEGYLRHDLVYSLAHAAEGWRP